MGFQANVVRFKYSLRHGERMSHHGADRASRPEARPFHNSIGVKFTVSGEKEIDSHS
jgi:hypothetical protein